MRLIFWEKKIVYFLYEICCENWEFRKSGQYLILEKIWYVEDFEFYGKILDIDSLVAKMDYYN